MMINHLNILTEKLQILLDKPSTKEETSSGRTNTQVETCAVAKARDLHAVTLLQAETEFAERYENQKRKEEFLASRRLIRHLYPDLPPVLKS